MLVEERIAALLTRGKPRDFFDLYFLLRKGLITPEMKPALSAVGEVLQGVTVDFKSELSQFLPRSYLGVMRIRALAPVPFDLRYGVVVV